VRIENIISELLVNIVTWTLDSVIPISYTAPVFWRSVDILHVTLTFDPFELKHL